MKTPIVLVVVIFIYICSCTFTNATRLPLKSEVNTISAQVGTLSGLMSTLPWVNEYGKQNVAGGYITLTPASNALRTVFNFTWPWGTDKTLFDLSVQITVRTSVATTQNYTWQMFNFTSQAWVSFSTVLAQSKRAIWTKQVLLSANAQHFIGTYKSALRIISTGSVPLQIDHLTAFLLPKVFVVDDTLSNTAGGSFDFYYPSSADGASVRARVSIPPTSATCLASKKTFSAIVLLHGSGGMWKDNNATAGIMNTQHRNWRTVFNTNCWVGMYLDSYTPRGEIEFGSTLPLNIKIAPAFVRSRDAMQGLYWLKKMVHTNNVTYWINGAKIGVQGFSHGGSSTEGAIFDTTAAPVGQNWSYDKTYYADDGVLPPQPVTLASGFRAAVAYYPGSGHNTYYGNPCNAPPTTGYGFYKNYAPLLLHVAELDSLTPNTACLKTTIQRQNGIVTYYSYAGADHGFDTEVSGADGTASTLAKERTINYWKQYLA